MPFHIRLQNRTEPKIAREPIVQDSKVAVLAEFCQGIAFGLGVALMMLVVMWLVQSNGLGV